MAKSSLVGVDRAPAIPKGRDIDAKGPSDSSDSGSDIQGELDLGADEVGLPRDLALTIEHSGDTDAAGTGERGAAMLDEPAREGADIGVDRITKAPDDGDAELPFDELDLEALSEFASSGPEDDDEEDEEDEEDEDGEDDKAAAQPVAPARKRGAKRSR
ncbi:MAG TPA: hypothetical protein VGQ23_11390 [Burkholderiaceae bacterium]|jgi:hypothetical protein|nr:hypothetical protein [Burkholderiaceae bacterium]